MAVSKVELNGETLINLQPTTADVADVAEGKVFFKADGTQAIGEATGGGSSFAPEYVSFYNYQGSSLNLNGLDTSNIENMNSMFNYCPNLTSLDLSNFNTSNVTDMSNMFFECSSLTTLTLPNSFDTSNVTEMSGMFSSCSSLTTLDLSNFNTSNVTSMRNMFSGCSSLTSLNLSNFNTSNVEYMFSMFAIYDGSTFLSSLDIRNFSFDGLSNGSEAADSMFDGVPSTCVIYVNQAAYDFIAADFNDQNNMRLADINMLQVVSNE